MRFSTVMSLTLLGAAKAQGCHDDGDGRFNYRIAAYHRQHVLKARSQPDTYLPAEPEKFRALGWGELNFIHVTDTHGWLGGHLYQDEYAADWGDFVSFTEHMEAEAQRRNVDLLVIETGDRHDGTGLSDSTPIDGSVSQLVFAQANFDVLSIGNHELYKADVAEQEYSLLRPYYGDRYLSSNVDIFDNRSGRWVPSGNRYRQFTTKNRRYRVLAFGFLFNFKGNANNTRVTKVQDAVKQKWFQDVVKRKDYDIILVTGHVPVRHFDEFDAVVHEIRQINPNVPIQGFGGHSHVRDYRRFDDNAVALESGRYLETIGWAGVTFGATENASAAFTRRYIDFNPENFAYHTNTRINTSSHLNKTLPAFQTERGLAISQMIANIRSNLTLNHKFGYVDRDYQTDWAAFPSNNSLFSLAADKAHPLLRGNVSRDHLPRLIICNTGNYRYPLLKGPYTDDSTYVVSPFTNAWLYAADIPIDLANKVLNHLNNDYPYIKKRDSQLDGIDWGKITSLDVVPNAGIATTTYMPGPNPTGIPHNRTVGYVTHDDYGSDGDDVPHIPYSVHKIPNAFETRQNIDNATTQADVIFVDFLEDDIKSFLTRNNWSGEVKPYGGKYSRDLIKEYFTS